jgi:hypothetical protein
MCGTSSLRLESNQLFPGFNRAHIRMCFRGLTTYRRPGKANEPRVSRAARLSGTAVQLRAGRATLTICQNMAVIATSNIRLNMGYSFHQRW